jgi:hypothetical protein
MVVHIQKTDVNALICCLTTYFFTITRHLAPTSSQQLWPAKHVLTIPAQCCASVFTPMLHYETHAVLLRPTVPTLLTVWPSFSSIKAALTA